MSSSEKKGKPGSKFVMRPCTGGSAQKFYLDEYGQLHLRNRPTLCVIWRKKSVYLVKCALGTDTSKALFTYDQDKKSFVAQKLKSLYMVGVKEDKKYTYEVVRLFIISMILCNRGRCNRFDKFKR